MARFAIRQKYSDSTLTKCSSSVTEAYASRGWAFSVRKCGPHLKMESNLLACSWKPIMYKLAAKASIDDNLFGFA